jgi:hypothetical protein
MTAPDIDQSATTARLAALRRHFLRLLIIQGVLFVAAAGFAVVYFALHRRWAAPAFALALGLALIAQIRFIHLFRSGRG